MDIMEISRGLDFEDGYVKEMVTFEGRERSNCFNGPSWQHLTAGS
jgi:hypothetical protein